MNNLKMGDKVPSFSLPSDEGSNIDINELKGKNIVIYFYPKDDTPGCTIEAKDFSCALEEFARLNAIVIGISRDSIKKHEKFRNNHQLKHLLLSDEGGEVCNKFSCWVEKSMYGKKYMGVARSTFLIDSEGLIRKIWNNVSVKGHVDEVLNELKNLA